MRKKYYRLDRSGLSRLVEMLHQRGYQVYAPRIQNAAFQWQPIDSLDDLPAGWTNLSQPARYRLQRTDSSALFASWTGPDSLKRLLHPPRVTVTEIQNNGDGLTIIQPSQPVVRRAFLGVRACDLAAVAALDRALLQDRYVDDIYRAQRSETLFIAVHCTSSAETCFCASTHTGPAASSGFDIALTERLTAESPEYLAESASAAGAGLLDELAPPVAPPEWARESAEACKRAAAAQTRAVHPSEAQAVLDRTFDHPRWDQTARRCLACGNCTSVCPTCFCVNFEERSSLDGASAQRLRVWDSCFTQSFSYIHGGSIRLTPKSRYRQWLSHKLARWQQQFAVPGCVGCGRCITWCPAGIDITEEFAVLQAAVHPEPQGATSHGH